MTFLVLIRNFRLSSVVLALLTLCLCCGCNSLEVMELEQQQQRKIINSHGYTTNLNLDPEIITNKKLSCEKYLTNLPWNVQIVFKNQGRDGLNFLCGGVLIHATVVLSSASCFEYKVEAELAVLDERSQQFDIKKIIRHPEFSSGSYYNDIALLQLKKPLPVNVTLNIEYREKNNFSDGSREEQEDDDYVKERGWMAGWKDAETTAVIVGSLHVPRLDVSTLTDVPNRLPITRSAQIMSTYECEQHYRYYYGQNAMRFDEAFPNGIVGSKLICANGYGETNCEPIQDKGYQLMITTPSLLSTDEKTLFRSKQMTLIGTRAQAVGAKTICRPNDMILPTIFTHTVDFTSWFVDELKNLQ